MTCKYYDCGWCYAPSEISTSATPDKKCLNPDACLYLKSQMTNDTKSYNYAKITSRYPIDDDIVEINGVKYQRIVEEPKPQTLLEIIREWNDDDDNPPCEILVDMIEGEWLPNDDPHDGEEYQLGWNACLEYLRKKLK